MTVNVVLNADVQRFLEEKVRAGQYASVPDAVNALLARVRAEEEISPADIEKLRAEIDIGLNELDQGQYAEFTAEDIIAEGRAARAAKQQG